MRERGRVREGGRGYRREGRRDRDARGRGREARGREGEATGERRGETKKVIEGEASGC